MLIHTEEITVSATNPLWTAGAVSVNTNHKLNGMLMALHVESDTDTTTFKFRIKDWNDRIIFDTEDYEENICNKSNIGIPLKDGFYELNIYSSSAEEEFKIMLSIDETA